MTYENRRRRMREALMAKAKQMQEADRKRLLENIRAIDKARRDLKRPYSPEAFAAKVRSLFGDGRRNAKIGK